MKKDKLKMKFKLNGLEFEMEGNEETVKTEFEKFKGFLTGDFSSKLVGSQTSPKKQNQKSLETKETPFIDIEDIDEEDNELMSIQEVVIKDLPNSEGDWIVVYAFYVSENGKKAFTADMLKEMYSTSKRKTDERIKRLKRNINRTITSDYLKVLNDDEYILKSKGIEYAKEILKGNSKAKVKTKSKNSDSAKESNSGKKSQPKTAFKIDGTINFRPEDKEHINIFMDKFDASKAPERILLIVHYLKNVLGIKKVTADQIYTGYDRLGIRIPKSLYQLISDTKNKFGYLEFENTDDITISIAGKNAVRLDLPKK